MFPFAVLLDPEPEPGEGRSRRRHLEGKTFQRSIAPRLIIGWEEGQVKTGKEVVIGHIEHPIVPVQIRWDEIYLDLVSDSILEVQLVEPSRDDIVLRIDQIMGSPCHIISRAGS